MDMDVLHFWILIIVVLCAICCFCIAPFIYWKCSDRFNDPGPQNPNEIEMQDFEREDNPEDVEWDYEREMEEYNRQLNRQVTDENTNQS